MTGYIARRLLRGAFTILIAVTITFILLRMMPGDPVTVMVDPRMGAEMREQMIIRFGLDRPLLVQYFHYIRNLLIGDLGFSFYYRRSVAKVILARLPWTILLMGTAQLITMLIGIPLGIIAGYKQGSGVDQAINTFAIFGIAIFIPWLGLTLLHLFGYRIPIFPIGGAHTPRLTGFDYYQSVLRHLVLPAISLMIIMIANYTLYMRSSIIDVLSEDYIRTARSKGVSERRVLLVHALRNAFLPTLTMAGLMIGRMAGGAVLTETIFAYPGLGRMIFEAVSQQDFPVLQGAFLILAFTVILMNILTDILYAYLDPRIELN
ncbi:MAG: ABC transporter permease [Bacillota bacterium]